VTPQELQALMAQRALGGMNANPTGFNPEMMAANAPMPNPNMGGGFLGALKRGAIGLQNGLGKVGQNLFSVDPAAAQNMSAQQIQGLRNQGMLEMGLGMLAAANKPRASFGEALAQGYFGAQKGALGRQQMAFQMGQENRAEARDEERYQTGLGRQARMDDLAVKREENDQRNADRNFEAGRDDEMWMRGFRNRDLAVERERNSAFTQANELSPEAIDLVAEATLRNPQLMNNYLSRSGMGNQRNRNLVTERQAQILKENGTTPDRIASIQANVKAHSQAIAQNQKAVSSLKAFESVVQNNGQRLNELLAKIPDTGIPLGNALTRGAKYNLGDADVAEFRQVLQNFQTETARIVAGHPQLLGNVTDTARKEIESIVNGNMTVAQTKRIVQRLMFESKVREQGFMDSMAESGRAIDQLGTPGAAFPGLGQPAPGAIPAQPGASQERVINWEDMQ
jgi:hypothetical protein